MKHTKTIKKLILSTILFIVISAGSLPAAAFAGSYCGDTPTNSDGTRGVKVSIDLGCSGKGNPIMDATFGIIRFLSDGVGLVIVGSVIVGGIQYSASSGDPQATNRAIERIRSSLIALLIFIFAYPLLNFLLPKGILQ